MNLIIKYLCFLILSISILFSKSGKQKTTNIFSSNLSLQIALKYNIYYPEDYFDVKHNYPLVLFLHGAGERGSNIDLVELHGIPKLIKEGVSFPFVTLAPQCPKFQYWSEPVNVKALVLLLEDVLKNYRIDPDRVYATGLSMGGYGTLAIAKERPDLFAGIISVCGGMDTTNIQKLNNMPIWLFHGEKDEVVPVENSRVIYESLKGTNPKINFTIYPDVKHNAWDITYDNKNIYKWLLEHKRSSKYY